MRLNHRPPGTPDNPPTRPCTSAGCAIAGGTERHCLITFDRLAASQHRARDQIVGLGAQLAAQGHVRVRRHHNCEQRCKYSKSNQQLDQSETVLPISLNRSNAPNHCSIFQYTRLLLTAEPLGSGAWSTCTGDSGLAPITNGTSVHTPALVHTVTIPDTGEGGSPPPSTT
ncbi:hypothetical protein D3C84_140250 [compost metagenome]